MSSLEKKLKFIGQWEQDLVFGYCRYIQTLLPEQHVPMAIMSLILLYHHEYDLFNYSSKDIQINECKDIIIRVDQNMWHQKAYGLMNITKGKLGLTYTWKFKISGDWSLQPPSIGIIQIYPHDIIPNQVDFYDDSNIFYVDNNYKFNLYSYWFSMIATGHKMTNISNKCYNTFNYDHMSGFKDGDIVKMKINTNYGTIQFAINDIWGPIAFDNIDFSIGKYRLRIRLGNNDYSIKLIEFFTHKHH